MAWGESCHPADVATQGETWQHPTPDGYYILGTMGGKERKGGIFLQFFLYIPAGGLTRAFTRIPPNFQRFVQPRCTRAARASRLIAAAIPTAFASQSLMDAYRFTSGWVISSRAP